MVRLVSKATLKVKDDTLATVVCDYGSRGTRPRPQDFALQFLLICGVATICFLVWNFGDLSFGQTNCTKTTAAHADVGRNGPLVSALDLFKFHNGRYPTRLRDLITAPSSFVATWRGPYLSNVTYLEDPWGREFRYLRIPGGGPSGHGERFNLWSFGPDGVNKTADDIRGP